ncbi:MAG: RagB/SusD family nutrient uptake outer membrane protein, partial [Bacteroidota bacterium]
MKIYNKIVVGALAIGFGLTMTNCSNGIETEVFGEITASEGGAASASTVNGLLDGVYAEMTLGTSPGLHFIYTAEFSADHVWNERGGLSNSSVFFLNWNWDAQNPSWIRTSLWAKPYRTIRNANFLLEIIDGADVPDADKSRIRAEARFLRATSYAYLFNWFGTVPLRTSPQDDAALGRASEAEMLSFIETELAEAAADLPTTADERGRATRGAAYGILMKHFLNTKNWTGVIQYADLIEDLGQYSLYNVGDNPHRDLFRVPLEEATRAETIYAI